MRGRGGEYEGTTIQIICEFVFIGGNIICSERLV